MNDPRSGVSMRVLFEAARGDGPGAAARAQIWGAVSASAATGAGVGTAGAMKMLVGGTLLGAAASVGVAATMIYIAGRHAPAMAAAGPSPNVMSVAPAPVVALSGTRMSVPVSAGTTAGIPAPVHAPRAPTSSGPIPPRTRVMSRGTPPLDALTREARLLDAARKAVVRGNDREALSAIRMIRALPERQLLPEELAVEGQALRMAGQGDQAAAVEADLRARYPESALAR